MGFFDSLKSMFASESASAEHWVYVRCHRCGEMIKTRIDLRNNLSLTDNDQYLVRKTLVGSQLCFERIHVTLYFDANRQPVNQEIAGGKFVTEAEYRAAASAE